MVAQSAPFWWRKVSHVDGMVEGNLGAAELIGGTSTTRGIEATYEKAARSPHTVVPRL